MWPLLAPSPRPPLTRIARALAAGILALIASLLFVPQSAQAAGSVSLYSSSGETTATGLWNHSDGTVWSWGFNGVGQLGNGTSGLATRSIAPVQVLTGPGTPLTNVVQVSAGDDTMLARKSDGTVWGWGYNGCGELMQGNWTNQSYAVQLKLNATTPITTAVNIASGARPFIVLSNGSIMSNSQMGGGCNSYPVALTYDVAGTLPITTATQVDATANNAHVAFLRSDGTVWAAGSNANGKLGRGVATYTTAYNDFQPVQTSAGVNVTSITKVSVGGFQTVVRKSDGTVWSAGYDGTGEISNSAVSGDVIWMTRMETSPGVALTGVDDVDNGTQQVSLVHRTDNSIWGTGFYEWGQQGEITCCGQPVRQRVTGFLAGMDASGQSTSLMIRASDNAAMGTGLNSRGEAGLCHTRIVQAPVVLPLTCSAPFAPWRPMSMAVLDADGSATRCLSYVCYTHSGVADSLQFTFTVSDQDTTDTLTPRWQFATAATAMQPTDACSAAGVALTPVNTTSSNQDMPVTRTQTGLVSGTQYHYRACTIDSGGRASGWRYDDIWRTGWGGIATYNAVTVDTGAPTAATSVIDGNPTDIDWINSTANYVGTFSGATDAISPIWGVSYCITTSATGTDCASGAQRTWTSVATSGTWTATGLTMTNGTKYYLCVKAEDYAKNLSPQLCSDGVTVDTTLPVNPATRNDGTGADIDILTSTTTLDGNWTAGSDTGGSGIQDYDYCFTTSSTGADCAAGAVKIWTATVGLTGNATGLSLTHGTTYYLCVRANDVAGNTAAAVCSDGATLDVSAPTVTPSLPANGATLVSVTPTLTAGYTDADLDNGTIDFDLCADATCTTVIQSGTSASVASGANGTWNPTSLAVSTQYWWRAQSTDTIGRSSAMSAIWTFTTISGPIVPNARNFNLVSPLWYRDAKDGGATCLGNGSNPDNDWMAIDEDIDAPVTSACVAGTGNPESETIQTGANPVAADDKFELSNMPGSMRTVTAVNLRFRAWKVGGKTATATVNLFAYDNSLIGTTGVQTLTTTQTNFAANLTGLTLYRTDLDGAYVQVIGDTSGGGASTNNFITAINLDLTATATNANQPTVPTNLSPLPAALTNTTPTLSARFNDPDVGDTGTMRFEVCTISGCNGSPRPDYFGSSSSGVAIGANGTWTTPALIVGNTYYWRARGRDNSGNEGPWTSWQSFTVDGPPAAPATVNDGTGADTDWTTTAGQLSANWAAVGDADLNRYEYCISTATNCTGTILSSPTWTSTVLATSVTKTGLVLSPGQIYFTCVRTVDNQSNVSTTNTCSDGQTFHRIPNVPTLVSPANAATNQALAPTLTVGYSDPDAHTGTVSYQVCSDAACTTVVRSGSSAVTTSGTNATWVVTPGLAAATTYYWRVMATDTPGASSAWSTPTWSFTTLSAPGIIDNQAGDLTWRNANTATYDVDFTDGVALANFETNVWSAAGQTGTQRQAWTQVATIGGVSYTTNWSLLASTWTAMAEGINYVSVRVTDTNALTSTNVDTFQVRKDTVAPPAIATLAATSPTIVAPALTWTTVTDATSGVGYYRVYRGPSSTGPWTQVSTDGAVTTGSYSDGTAVVNTTYFYKVDAVDLALNEAVASNVVSVYYHRAPNPPTLVSPANTSLGTTLTPNLTATHSDADGHTGTLTFEVCSDSLCSSVIRTGTSAAGIASGSNGSWTVSAALAFGTQYWWRAKSTDSQGAVGTYSVIWTFTTAPAPTVASTTPNTAPQGRKGLTVQVNGSGFQNGATVVFSGAGISVTGTTWVSATRIDVTIDIAGAAATGARNVTVTNPDTGAGTGTGVFTIIAPTITLSLSTLGFADATRDTTVPYDLAFGILGPGITRDIGPVGSGQTLAGAAIQATVTSDTTSLLQVTGASWTSAGPTMAAGVMSWKHNGVAEAYTAMTTSAVTTDGPTAPATTTFNYDLRLAIPAAQAAAAYSTTLTYTAIAAP